MMKKEAAGIIFTDGNKILLLKRNDKGNNGGKWDIPGGKKEPGETPYQNAMREAKEECGYNHGSKFHEIEDEDEKRIFSIFFHRVNKLFEAKISDEHVDWDWIDMDRLNSTDLHPKLERMANRIRNIIEDKIDFKEWMKCVI